MAGDGERKSMTISRVSEEKPGEFGEKKSYKVDSDIGVVQVVLPKTDSPPKVGDSLMGTLYPPKPGTSFPPSFYPSQGRGGGPRGKSPEEIRSIAAQTALIRATELAAAGKIDVERIPTLTREFYSVLKELAA